MIKSKPWVGGTDEEYENQHFGFGAERFKVAVRQMVEQKITSGIMDMQNYVQESLNLNEKDKMVLTNSCHRLARMFCDRAGPSLESIDEEIDKLMKVPSNVLLPGDEVQENQFSDEEYEKLKEEVASLRKRVERGALMEALLSAEEQELDSIKSTFEVAKRDMKVLDDIEKDLNSTSLKSIQEETQALYARVLQESEKEGLEFSDH